MTVPSPIGTVEGRFVYVGNVLWIKWDPKTASVVGRVRIESGNQYGWRMAGDPAQYPYTDLSWTNPNAY